MPSPKCLVTTSLGSLTQKSAILLVLCVTPALPCAAGLVDIPVSGHSHGWKLALFLLYLVPCLSSETCIEESRTTVGQITRSRNENEFVRGGGKDSGAKFENPP